METKKYKGLDKCPFCDGESVKTCCVGFYYKTWFVRCLECGAIGPTAESNLSRPINARTNWDVGDNTERRAAELWNDAPRR